MIDRLHMLQKHCKADSWHTWRTGQSYIWFRAQIRTWQSLLKLMLPMYSFKLKCRGKTTLSWGPQVRTDMQQKHGVILFETFSYHGQFLSICMKWVWLSITNEWFDVNRLKGKQVPLKDGEGMVVWLRTQISQILCNSVSYYAFMIALSPLVIVFTKVWRWGHGTCLGLCPASTQISKYSDRSCCHMACQCPCLLLCLDLNFS